jgi:hypothetical protein
MPHAHDQTPSGEEDHPYREYVLGVRIVEVEDPDGATRYRFEAPRHEGKVFEDAATAELYADVYFDANGFEEAGTGDRGVPPEVIQAGRDTLAAYFLTMPGTDRNWVASFYGLDREVVDRYVQWVSERAAEIRTGFEERSAADPEPAE